MYENQRKYTRHNFGENEKFFLEYKKTASPFFIPWQTALTQNISAGGLLFRTQEILSIGTLLNVRLSIPSISKPIKIKTKVVRVDSTRRSNFYDTALFFLEIDPLVQKQLDEFCKLLAEKNKKDPEEKPFI